MRLRGDSVILRAGVKRPTPSLGQPNHYGLESAKPTPQSMFEKAAARQWAVVEQPRRSAEDRFLAFHPFIGLILKGSKGSKPVQLIVFRPRAICVEARPCVKQNIMLYIQVVESVSQLAADGQRAGENGARERLGCNLRGELEAPAKFFCLNRS